MKGRYEHGSIFAVQDNTTKLNPNEEGTDVNGKPIQDENYLNSLPRPQFNSVKPGLPAFSFSKAERFYTKQPYKSKNLEDESERMLFKDGKFAPDDQKFFSTMGIMGKPNFDSSSKSSKSIGPPYYLIKGFADIIVEEGAKVNEIRTKIREKEKREEEEKRNKSQGDNEQSADKRNILNLHSTNRDDSVNEQNQSQIDKESINHEEEKNIE